jgi:hypothetical protein
MDPTLGELIASLQEIAQEVGEDVPVRVIIQPNYPLRLCLAGVTASEEEGVMEACVVAADEHPQRGSPYASKSLWNNLI